MFRLKNKRLTRIVGSLEEEGVLFEDQTLAQMFELGIDIVRIKLSSSNYKVYTSLINKVYNVAGDKNAIVGVILDIPSAHRILKTPGDLNVSAGEPLYFSTDASDEEAYRVNALGEGVVVGASVVFGEEVSGEVTSVDSQGMHILIKNDGVIYNGARVYAEGSCKLENNFSEKQLRDLEFCSEANVDFISVGFSEENFEEELKVVSEKIKNKKIKILCRVETAISRNRLEEMVEVCDGIIIARCPMGAEMPIQRICTYQKEIVNLCSQKAKPVVVSGHVLGSLRNLPYPLRADACDVYNGVLDGIDGFVLSSDILREDTWRNALEMITNILETAEGDIDPRSTFQKIWLPMKKPSVAEAIASSAVKTCIELEGTFILCLAQMGRAPRMIAKYKPPMPIITVSSLLRTAQQCLINRGTVPLLGDVSDYRRALGNSVEDLRPYCKPGSTVVVVTEWPDNAKHLNEQMGVLNIE